MRTPFVFFAFMTTAFLAGCGESHPVRSVEFYKNPENSAEYAKALELCQTAGTRYKEMCVSVWQAKFAFDQAQNQMQFEHEVRERARAKREQAARAAQEAKEAKEAKEGGLTIVPQTPRAVTAAPPFPDRRLSSGETADAATPPTRN